MTRVPKKRTPSRTRRAPAKRKIAVHPDVHPIGRVATEFFLRSFEHISQLDSDIVSCLVITTLLHGALDETADRKPMAIRELSRRLALPFETVRRHVRKLVRSGVCVAESDGVALAATKQQGTRLADVRRKIYLQTIRMLGDLRRIEVANYRPRRLPSPGSRQLDKEQAIVAAAAIGLLLTAMKVLRHDSGGDLMSGLILTAIRATNVKHMTNKAPAANRDILPDSDRIPVSIMTISNSMGLPYETVRRHARKLVRDGKCVQVGRLGLMVPKSWYQRMRAQSDGVLQLVMGFIAELRANGVKL